MKVRLPAGQRGERPHLEGACCTSGAQHASPGWPQLFSVGEKASGEEMETYRHEQDRLRWGEGRAVAAWLLTFIAMGRVLPCRQPRRAGWVHGVSHSSARHNPTPSRNATETLLPKDLLGVGKGQGSWVTFQCSRLAGGGTEADPVSA